MPGAFKTLNVKGHVFANAGNNMALARQGGGAPPAGGDKSWRLFERARSVVGVGLVMPLQSMRVELNYCWPVRIFKADGDRFARWQVGVGFES